MIAHLLTVNDRVTVSEKWNKFPTAPRGGGQSRQLSHFSDANDSSKGDDNILEQMKRYEWRLLTDIA